MAYYILKSYKLNIEPLRIFEALKSERNCFFLDSSLNGHHLGRFSFLGAEPFYILETKNQNPFPQLREVLNCYRFTLPKSDLPFLGGAVGFFAYDLGFILEKKTKHLPKSDLGIPDCLFGFYNTGIIIDHWKKLLYLFATGFPEKKDYLAKKLAKENFKERETLLEKISQEKDRGQGLSLGKQTTELKSSF
ncbi:MAG: hypothetical protein HZA27_01720, partial [Candidatus Omnitrophica bacterium]|nr:hypothetical protein [Candidatus Omnitrophota bacterium]